MWWLLPLGCFASAVGLHAAITRVAPSGNRVNQFLAAGCLAGAWLIVRGWSQPVVPQLAGLVGYAFACELYLFTFTFVTSSVSVSLLISRQAPGRSEVSLAGPAMVTRRLQNMTEAGLLQKQDDRFRLTARAATIVQAYRWGRRFFRHDSP